MRIFQAPQGHSLVTPPLFVEYRAFYRLPARPEAASLPAGALHCRGVGALRGPERGGRGAGICPPLSPGSAPSP